MCIFVEVADEPLLLRPLRPLWLPYGPAAVLSYIARAGGARPCAGGQAGGRAWAWAGDKVGTVQVPTAQTKLLLVAHTFVPQAAPFQPAMQAQVRVASPS